MNFIATIEVFKSFDKVNYYTVRFEIDGVVEEDSETDKFLKKFLLEPDEPVEEAQIIYMLIEKIGYRGAFKRYFRFEMKADALPPQNKFLKELKIEFDSLGSQNLRLYCIRLSESIVILLNGGVKTTHKAQDCPNVSSHFRMANKLAQFIEEALKSKEISILGNKLKFDKDFVLTLE